MRLYSFVMGNYLNAGQHGIQTGHAAVDIARSQNVIAGEWADNHKTFIILNAHNFAGLKDVEYKLSWLIDAYNMTVSDSSQKLPYTSFYEDEESVNGIMTCFACVLPEEFYNNLSEINKLNAVETTNHYWEAVKNNYAILDTQDRRLNLIKCTLKQYNLVQL